MKKLLPYIREKIQRQIQHPIEELNRFQRALRYAYDLTVFCAEKLAQDRAFDMAAALTYRTIFSLVPTIVLMLVVFRAFISFDQAQQFLETQVYQYLEFDALTIQNVQQEKQTEPALVDNADAQQTEDQSQTEQETVATVQGLISSFVEKGYRINIGSVGGLGLLLLVYAAIALAVTVEFQFNRIYSARTGRRWHHRVLIYWAVITLGPVFVFMSMYLTGRIYGAATELPVIGALFQAGGSLGALVTSWLLLLLLYLLMPNTNVHLRPALIGSFVAAVLWEVVKVGFKFYVTKAVGYSFLYGSLGLVPLFLFWVYLTWLIVLFGLELTYALQNVNSRKMMMERRRAQRGEDDRFVDARYVLPVMTAIGEGFARGQALACDDLAHKLNLPGDAAAGFLNRLTRAGLVHQLDDGRYTLAKPAENIPIADLLKLSRSVAHLDEQEKRRAPGWAMLAELNAAETETAADRTLADTLQSRGQGKSPQADG